MPLIKVSAKSRPAAVAGSIAGTMRDYRYAGVRAIGPAAVSQAVKAIAAAHRYLLNEGIDIRFIPEFVNVDTPRDKVAAIRFIIEPKGWCP